MTSSGLTVMRRTALRGLVAVAVAAGGAVACGDADPEPGATSTPTVATTAAPPCGRSGELTTYCGTARATVQVGGTSLTYTGGECHPGPGHVVVVIGSFPEQAANSPDRFALGVGNYEQDPVFGTVTTPAPFGPGAAGDGSYTRSTLRVYTAGKRYSASGFVVTLAEGRSRGEFTASTEDGTALTGRFTC